MKSYFLIFDAPTLEKEDRDNYSLFLKQIKSFGYEMIQKSVYQRFERSTDSDFETEKMRIQNITPKSINVISFAMSENEYNDIFQIFCEQLPLWSNNDLMLLE